MLEFLLDPLGALVITFFALSVISILGIGLLFFTKNEKRKKGIFYGLSIWGLVIAYCNLQMCYSFMTGSIIIAVLLGLLAVAAVLIQRFGKSENRFKAAQMLAAVSVVVGMVDTFMI